MSHSKFYERRLHYNPRLNKNMQNIKPFSRSLKKFIAKTNPQQREVTLYFQRSSSAQKLYHPTLPTLTHHEPHLPLLRRKAHSQKIKTEPPQSSAQSLISYNAKQPTLQQNLDDIMYTLIDKGEIAVQCSKQMKDKLEKKKLKNLRVVTEQAQSGSQAKKRRALEDHLESIIQGEQSERQKVKKRYTYQNPHVQKKVTTRWEPNQSKGMSKQALPYYPLIDLRQENQQTLLNIPATTDEYLRRLRQTVFYKGPKPH